MNLNDRVNTSPAARQLLCGIYSYMNSPKFAPQTEVDIDTIKQTMQ
jgi:hypothetical protein